ncbi:hypothetical protein ACJZ2D_017014 [Fusarium nematophilum]
MSMIKKGNTIMNIAPLEPAYPLRPVAKFPLWIWKRKLVLVIDEIGMLGGATLYDVGRHLQSLRDCPNKPFSGIPIVILMGDFHQFAPVHKTSLLVSKTIDPALAPVSQATISHHQGSSL